MLMPGLTLAWPEEFTVGTPRLQLSEGTIAAPAEVEYEAGAIVPQRPWREANSEELKILRSATDTDGRSSIAVVRLGSEVDAQLDVIRRACRDVSDVSEGRGELSKVPCCEAIKTISE